jgi:hypothetical protein
VPYAPTATICGCWNCAIGDVPVVVVDDDDDDDDDDDALCMMMMMMITMMITTVNTNARATTYHRQPTER